MIGGRHASPFITLSNWTLCKEDDIDDLITINLLRTITAFISLVVCLAAIIVLFCFLYSTKYRERWYNLSHRLILGFLFAAFFYCVSTCLQWVRLLYDELNEDSVRSCEAVAFLVEYFSWSLILMTLLLIIRLFYILYSANIRRCCKSCNFLIRLSDNIKLLIYLGVAFGLPLTFTWIPFIPDIKGYGVSGYWCWIMVCDENNQRYIPGYVHQALMWYASIFIVMAVIVVLSIAVICRIWTNRNRKVTAITCPLLLFPLIFFGVNMISLVNRITVMVLGFPIPVLAVLNGFIDSLWGVLAAFIFFSYLCIIECNARPAFSAIATDGPTTSPEDLEILLDDTVCDINNDSESEHSISTPDNNQDTTSV